MQKDTKRSFFERLTGTVRVAEDDETAEEKRPVNAKKDGDWIGEENDEGQLTVDVYQTPNDIFIKTIVAGVRPEDLDVSITRDMVTIKGHREETREVEEDQYFHRELYWGSFSRTILLPEEVEVEEAEASERYGLLSIRLPKINKQKQTKLRIKSV